LLQFRRSWQSADAKVLALMADKCVEEAQCCVSRTGDCKTMSIQGLNQAAGADLLSFYTQNAGGIAAATYSASMAVLKTAISETQLSAAQLVAQTSGADETGTQLNVYG
jgi:hypothetical protein